jgi:hypothetical protein
MRWIRRFLIALLLSLLIGLAIGTAIRMRLERPVEYLGLRSALPARPLDVDDVRSAVLDPRHDEEQIG